MSSSMVLIFGCVKKETPTNKTIEVTNAKKPALIP
jgi:hypothetical protein